MTYQIYSDPSGNYVSVSRFDEDRTVLIPFDPENRDYKKFMLDWADGAQVIDADGSPVPYTP